jgi:hypothetical protein
MVETSPSNEDINPYYTQDNDDEADQLRTVLPPRSRRAAAPGKRGLASGGGQPFNDACRHQKAHCTIEAEEWKREKTTAISWDHQHMHNPAKSRHCYRGTPLSNWVWWQL